MTTQNITATFERLKEARERALVAFVTAGDPDMDRSFEVLEALCRGGADLIELGVPFSDPMADGPAIQRSSQRALGAGATLAGALGLVRRFRERHAQPLILFGYYNPFFQYGLERLAKDAAEAGVDGLLVVDLPFEEAGPMRAALERHGLALIPLIAPTSTPERIAAIARLATGFVYYVSRTGVTGVGGADASAIAEQLAKVREEVKLPICVGFGVSRPQHVEAIAPHAEGVVVGSAIVEGVERLGQGLATLAEIEEFARSLKAPLAPLPA